MSERQANRRKTFFKLKLVLLLSSPKQFSVKGPVGFILHLVFVLFFLLVLPHRRALRESTATIFTTSLNWSSDGIDMSNHNDSSRYEK